MHAFTDVTCLFLLRSFGYSKLGSISNPMKCFNDLDLAMYLRYGCCKLRKSSYILSRNYLSSSFSIQRKACLNGLRHLVLLLRWKNRSVSDLKMFRIFIWSINEHIFYKILGSSIAHNTLKKRYLTTGQQLVEFQFVLWSLVGFCQNCTSNQMVEVDP